METARGEWREVDKRAKALMEVAARDAPSGRCREPDLALERAKVGIDCIAKGRGDQRLGRIVGSEIPVAGLDRAKRSGCRGVCYSL